jgi:light-regulated signal transduction histidine kinase (bacteriophytochrome)
MPARGSDLLSHTEEGSPLLVRELSDANYGECHPAGGFSRGTTLLRVTSAASTPDQREYLGMVKSSTDALLTIINDILDFSKMDAGKLKLDPIAFSFRDSLGETVKLLAAAAHEKGLEVIVNIQPNVPEFVWGDPTRLRQVITNLVGHATKFTEHGEIELQGSATAASMVPTFRQASADGDDTRQFARWDLGSSEARRQNKSQGCETCVVHFDRFTRSHIPQFNGDPHE